MEQNSLPRFEALDDKVKEVPHKKHDCGGLKSLQKGLLTNVSQRLEDGTGRAGGDAQEDWGRDGGVSKNFDQIHGGPLLPIEDYES